MRDDDGLFERLTLEAFQSGLSWLTILRKRDNFRKAFAGFEIEAVARFDATDRAGCWPMPGSSATAPRSTRRWRMHRCRAAGRGLAALIWSHAPEPVPAPKTLADVPATTPASVAMAKDLKRRGFGFVGPTTAYALMQAVGLVNDHLADCSVRERMG